MKISIGFVAVMVGVTAWAQTEVVFPLRQMTGSALNRTITITSLDGPRIVGTNTVYPTVVQVVPAASVGRTNLYTGNYRVTVNGISGYTDGFVPDTNVVMSWVSCAEIPPGSVNLPSYYTKAEVDDLIGGVSVDTNALNALATSLSNSVATSNLTVSGSASFNSLSSDSVSFTEFIGVIGDTNIANGSVGTNHFDATAYSLLMSGTVPAGTLTNGQTGVVNMQGPLNLTNQLDVKGGIVVSGDVQQANGILTQGSNVIAEAGSTLNGVGLTNGAVTVTGGTNEIGEAIFSAGMTLGGERITTWPAASVNTSSNYTWSGSHSFSNTITTIGLNGLGNSHYLTNDANGWGIDMAPNSSYALMISGRLGFSSMSQQSVTGSGLYKTKVQGHSTYTSGDPVLYVTSTYGQTVPAFQVNKTNGAVALSVSATNGTVQLGLSKLFSPVDGTLYLTGGAGTNFTWLTLGPDSTWPTLVPSVSGATAQLQINAGLVTLDTGMSKGSLTGIDTLTNATFASLAGGAVLATTSGLQVTGDIQVSGILYGGNTTNISMPILTFPSATNTLVLMGTDCQYLLVSATDCAVTNVTGLAAGLVKCAELCVSNSAATAITLRYTALGRRIGAGSTNVLSIPAGKLGFLNVKCSANTTNYMTAVEQ